MFRYLQFWEFLKNLDPVQLQWKNFQKQNGKNQQGDIKKDTDVGKQMEVDESNAISMEGKRQFTDLPIEILYRIVPYFDKKDLLSVAQANSTLNAITTSPKYMKHFIVRLKHAFLQEDYPFFDVIRKSQRLFPNLSFNNCSFDNSEDMLPLWRKLGPQLNSLEIYTTCDCLFNHKYYLLLIHAINLRHLTLYGDCCINLDFLYFQRGLEKLTLIVRPDSELLLTSLTNVYPQVKALRIEFLGTENSINFGMMHLLNTVFPGVKQLCLKPCAADSLERLFDSENRKILVRLEVTVDQKNRYRTTRSHALENIHKLENLQFLSIWHLNSTYVSRNNRSIFADFCFENLKSLRLSDGPNVSDGDVLWLAANCKNITHLAFKFFPRLTEDGLKQLFERMKSLVLFEIEAKNLSILNFRRAFGNPYKTSDGRFIQMNLGVKARIPQQMIRIRQANQRNAQTGWGNAVGEHQGVTHRCFILFIFNIFLFILTLCPSIKLNIIFLKHKCQCLLPHSMSKSLISTSIVQEEVRGWMMNLCPNSVKFITNWRINILIPNDEYFHFIKGQMLVLKVSSHLRSPLIPGHTITNHQFLINILSL